jgi:hypothetical protein
MLTLLVRQAPKSGFETSEPFAAVGNPPDVLAGVDQPVHEHSELLEVTQQPLKEAVIQTAWVSRQRDVPVAR